MHSLCNFDGWFSVYIEFPHRNSSFDVRKRSSSGDTTDEEVERSKEGKKKGSELVDLLLLNVISCLSVIVSCLKFCC